VGIQQPTALQPNTAPESDKNLTILFDTMFRCVNQRGNLPGFDIKIEDCKDDIRKTLTFLYGLENIVTEILEGETENFFLPIIALNGHLFSVNIAKESQYLCLDIFEREASVRQAIEKKQEQIKQDPFHWSKNVTKDTSNDLDFTQGLLDTEGIIFYVIDKDGKFLQTNRYFQEMCGFGEESMVGASEEDVLSKAFLSKNEIKTEFVGPHQRTLRCEEKFVKANLESMTFQMQRRTLVSGDGTPYATASLGVNISKLKSVEGEMARSNKALEQFAYLASHDLQAPINRVLGFLGILKENNSEDREFAISAIETSACRMRSLVRGLLSMSTASGNKLNLQTTLSEDLLEAALENLRAKDFERTIEISIEMPKARVVCDPELILQVFENLLSNAVRFQSKARPLKISMGYSSKDQKHRFYVSDNGSGLKEELHENLFKKKKQSQSKEKNENADKGSGLGLTICNRIIEAHGGEIWGESDGKSGSTFFFEFPELEIRNEAP